MCREIYREVAGLTEIGKRSIRREDAKAFGYKFLYQWRKNKYSCNVIQGSKGDMIGACWDGDKIHWTEMNDKLGNPYYD